MEEVAFSVQSEAAEPSTGLAEEGEVGVLLEAGAEAGAEAGGRRRRVMCTTSFTA